MDFSYPFDEFQRTFSPFGVDVVPPQSPRPFMEGTDSLFDQEASSFTGGMPDVYIPQDSSIDSVSFDGDSPFLPNSGSVTESSPLSSPGANSIEIKQEIKQEPMTQPLYSPVEISSTDVSPKGISLAPERKRKRKQQPSEMKSSHKQQGTGKKRRAQCDSNGELNPDDLVQMNSFELEGLFHQLQVEGRVKPEDDKMFRKIIRQVKNRESAQASRTRHRDYMGFIEAKLKHQELVESYLRDYANQLKGLLVSNNIEVPP